MEQHLLIKGIKKQMSQVFLETGEVVPVTVIGTDYALTDDLANKDVVLVGKSKGKGFAGVMKRWSFAGGETTRGQSDKPRAPGSIGGQTPGRVLKGKKMAGRLGNAKITLKGVKIVGVNPESKELMVSGPVPGARNSKVSIKVL
jgi:large subunit ribosomal protein L3